MKKLFISILFLLISTCAFSEVFSQGENLIEVFLEKGLYLKLIKNENNIVYVMKDKIVSIKIDEDDIELSIENYNSVTGNNDSESFSVNRWNCELDVNNNLIISRKKQN